MFLFAISRPFSHAGRPQAPVRGPAPEHHPATCHLSRLRYFIFPARVVSWRRDVVSYIKCGRVQSWHTRTLLISKVLGRGVSGRRRALPRAQLGAPRPQAREPDVGRARPSVVSIRRGPRRTASRHSHLERRRGHVKLIDFGTSKDLEDSTLNGREPCGNQPVSRLRYLGTAAL